MSEHEYAFDATFAAVVRVSAPSEQSARDALGRLLDCASINVILFDFSSEAANHGSIRSYYNDGHTPFLFEIDGKNVEVTT